MFANEQTKWIDLTNYLERILNVVQQGDVAEADGRRTMRSNVAANDMDEGSWDHDPWDGEPNDRDRWEHDPNEVDPEELRVLTVLAMLHREALTIEELTDRLDSSRETLLEDLEAIREAGFRVDCRNDRYHVVSLESSDGDPEFGG